MAQDQRERRREGSRRAQASRQRRQDAHGQRKKQKYIYGGAGAVIIAVVVALVVLLQGGGADLGFPVRTLGGVHSPPFDYVLGVVIDGDPERVPPTSGNHLAQLSPYGFLGDTLIPESVVHNMEHGSVVIWYEPDNPEIAAQVNQLVRGLGSQCIVAGSYADMTFVITATVWGRVLPLDTFDESQLRAFINEYRGDEGPESGLCRQQS
jgi:hypothetical protein